MTLDAHRSSLSDRARVLTSVEEAKALIAEILHAPEYELMLRRAEAGGDLPPPGPRHAKPPRDRHGMHVVRGAAFLAAGLAAAVRWLLFHRVHRALAGATLLTLTGAAALAPGMAPQAPVHHRAARAVRDHDDGRPVARVAPVAAAPVTAPSSAAPGTTAPAPPAKRGAGATAKPRGGPPPPQPRQPEPRPSPSPPTPRPSPSPTPSSTTPAPPPTPAPPSPTPSPTGDDGDGNGCGNGNGNGDSGHHKCGGGDAPSMVDHGAPTPQPPPTGRKSG